MGYKRKVPPGKLLHRLPWDKFKSGSADNPQLIFSPDGRYLTATMEVRLALTTNTPHGRQQNEKLPALHVWDTRSGKLLHKFPNCLSMGWENRPLFSPDGKLLASYHHSGGWYVARLHALPGGQQIAEIQLDPNYDYTLPLKFSDDGTLFACGRKYMLVCDTRTGKLMPTPDLERSRHVAFDFSPDGRFVASGAYDGHIRIWNVKTGKKVFERRPNRHGCHVAFTPDGKRLISVHENRTAVVWRLPFLKETR